MSDSDLAEDPPTPAAQTPARRKQRYHHGDLRSALIAAGRRLAEEHGAEGVTFAAASRLAGVSATAPYRHFRDRDDFQDHVAASVFDEIAACMRQVRSRHPRGSSETLIALGKTYVDFHAAHPKLYGLLWGDPESRDEDSETAACGRKCFDCLIGAIEDWLAANPDAIAPPATIAAPMWMAVHGLASLGNSRAFASVAPDMTPHMMIELTVPRILEGVKARGVQGKI